MLKKLKTNDNHEDGLEPILCLSKSENRKAEGGLHTKSYFKKSYDGNPLISIITVVYNGEKYLEETIQSVINQTYDNVEYIIIDGGSTDGTIDIIRKYEDQIDYWVSEKDHGISDAFNKGITCSTGEFIGLINADDWYELDAIETLVTQNHKINHFIFGGCTYIAANGTQTYVPPDHIYSSRIRYIMPHLNHPTVFVKREIYQKYGLFNTSCKIAMDYEFFLRLSSAGCYGIGIDKNIAFMRSIGISVSLYKKVRKEVRNISIKYGLNPLIAYGIYFFLLTKNFFRNLGK